MTFNGKEKDHNFNDVKEAMNKIEGLLCGENVVCGGRHMMVVRMKGAKTLKVTDECSFDAPARPQDGRTFSHVRVNNSNAVTMNAV